MKRRFPNFASKLLKIPSWVLILGGGFTWLYWESISFIIFLLLALKLLLNKSQWSSHFKLTLFKFVLVAIILERIFIPLAGTWSWELSRGGAKFHFENFWTNEQMEKYFRKHYSIGSDANVLIYDIETAGVQCKLYESFEEEQHYRPSKEEKEKYGSKDFDYFRSYDCHKGRDISRLIAYWSITVYTNKDNKITHIIAFFDGLYI